MKAITYKDETMGADYDVSDIPAEMMAEAQQYREKLIEKVSEHDDKLLEKYLSGAPINEDEIKAPCATASSSRCVKRRRPSSSSSAARRSRTRAFSRCSMRSSTTCRRRSTCRRSWASIRRAKEETLIERPASDDAPFAALAFKIMTDPFVGQLTFIRVYSGVLTSGSSVYNATKGRSERVGRLLKMHANKREEIKEVYAGDIAAAVGLKQVSTGDTLCDEKKPIILESMDFPEPVISLAIEPKTKGDQEKLGQGLAKLMAEDPTFRVNTDEQTGQVVIRGMGELHLEIIVDRLKREFSVDASVGKPQVATRRRSRVRPMARGVRAPDGRTRQYGHAKIHLFPAEPGTGYVFENEIVGGSIPREYIKPIDEGIKEALTRGILAGYPGRRREDRAVRRVVPRRRFVGNGVQDRRLDGVPGCGEEGEARSARTGDARRSGRPEGLHGRRDGRSGQPARTHSVAGGSRRHADHQCARAAVGDVRLRNGSAVADAGARNVLDALRSLRTSTAIGLD
jgi:elongation factor G